MTRNVPVVFLLLLAAWVLGFVDELVHAKDAWASMPEGLIMSVLVAGLATAATVLGFSTLARESFWRASPLAMVRLSSSTCSRLNWAC